MRPIIALWVLIASAVISHAQGISDAEIAAKRQALKEYLSPDPKKEMARMFQCRAAPDSLIGLSLDDLRIKCGRWSRSNVTTTALGKSEQLIFTNGPDNTVMYVYTFNGVVTAVQSR